MIATGTGAHPPLGTTDARPGVFVETTDVCVVFFPNRGGFPFPDVATVRRPDVVRFRYVDGGVLLWLPNLPLLRVASITITPAPQPAGNDCAVAF